MVALSVDGSPISRLIYALEGNGPVLVRAENAAGEVVNGAVSEQFPGLVVATGSPQADAGLVAQLAGQSLLRNQRRSQHSRCSPESSGSGKRHRYLGCDRCCSGPDAACSTTCNSRASQGRSMARHE